MKTYSHNIRKLITSFLILTLVFLGGCGGFPTVSPPPGGSPSGPAASQGLRVHFIDVGQGDSILAESDGRFMLVDAGENNQADTVINYLKDSGVTSLDYVIGTHPHSDHIGGLDKVIDAFPVETVILPPVEHTTRTFEDVLEAVSNKGLKITRPVPGDEYSLGMASFTILSPVRDYDTDLNNWSVGIRLSYGNNGFVMCGDAEAEAEQDMVQSSALLKADVLKAGHHGSSTSTSDDFLRKISPSFVVIQCGEGNSYGHPHKETMEKLQKAGCQVFRTDESGTIVASADGSRVSWTMSKGAPQDKSPEPSQNLPGSQEYILNTNTKKYHLPDCASALDIKPENRIDSNQSREELEDLGYEPCGRCKP